MSTDTHHALDSKAEARGYVFTLVALLILTGITFGAAYVDFGSGNIVIALAIASLKASLVALFFMHLLHDKPVNAVIAVAGFIFLGLFLMFDFIDVTSRGDVEPQNLRPPVMVTAPAPAGAATPAAGAAAPSAGAATAPAAGKKE
jgi:cytochrome c oxidase subunit 4